MKKATKVLIGIQARTNSTRLPNKAMLKIQGTPIIDHVINAGKRADRYVNRFEKRTGTKSMLWVLIPKGDPLKDYIEKNRPHDVSVHEGDPEDLVDRYNTLAKELDVDYVVRVTADCPLLPPFLVFKSLNTAIKNEYDFLDNTNADYRTFFDGADVEVMSRRTLDWLHNNAEEREHVCSDLRTNHPNWMKRGHVFSYLDLSAIKLSVDTQKDFDLVTNQYKSVQIKKRKWEDKYGKGTAHMF